jgi:type VI secretion system secreted protein VgrG
LQQKVGTNYALDAGTEIHLKGGTNVVVESGTTLTLKVGGNFINISSGGIFIKGTMVFINSGGMAGAGAGASPEAPTAPQEADKADPGQADEKPPMKRAGTPVTYSPLALTLQAAAQNGAALCDPFT